MSAQVHGRALRGIVLALSGAFALALAGCDSSDDDSGGGSEVPGPDAEVPTASTFAAIVALGASDEPAALDAEVLRADLDARFGTASDDPVDVEEDEDIATAGKRDERR